MRACFWTVSLVASFDFLLLAGYKHEGVGWLRTLLSDKRGANYNLSDILFQQVAAPFTKKVTIRTAIAS
jgi:hypothetical protein